MEKASTSLAPTDTKRVFLNEASEINYWLSKFNCTEEELRKAIDAVGNSAVAIDDFLGST
jgi:hypothetical protein